MQSVKRNLAVSIFLALGLVTQSTLITRAQTPDTKPRPTSSITGRVMIGDKPAPGVTVVANLLSSPQTLVAQATSDADGKYRLAGLPPTGLTIGAYAPTFIIPNAPMYSQGRMVLLSADETVEGVDFKLTKGGVITGRVTDAEGKPVVEDRISLTMVDDKGEPSRGASVRLQNPFSYSTDDRGIYRIYGLPAGRYKVSIGDSGGAGILRSGYYQKTYYPDTTDVSKASIVQLSEGGEAKNIDISVGPRSRTYTVSGRVIDADNGQPIAGASYAFGALSSNQGQSYMNSMNSPGTLTNSKGEFRLEGIAPGRYAITAPASFYQPITDQPKIYSDPLPFEVTDGDVTNLEIKAQRSLTLSGVVITEGIANKNALAGVSRLTVVGYNEATSSGVRAFVMPATSQIAPDGSFQLEGLRPGSVSLEISSNAGESKGYGITKITADREVRNRQLELAAGQNVSGVRIYLSYGSGVIRGEIKIEGGTLPSDAMIYISLQQQEGARLTTAQADARGRFIMSGIPAGNYEAILQIISFGASEMPRGMPRTQRQSVAVSDDVESQVSFSLNLTPKVGP